LAKIPQVDAAPGAGRSDARRNRVLILEAAAVIFAEQGASASTEAVAARAGVAIGTVFRHFPAKPDLLSAVVMNAWEQLVAEVDGLVGNHRDEGALASFCASVMTTSAANRAVLVKLAETGTRVHVGDALQQLRPRIQVLLERAQKAGVVSSDLKADELIALLGALCQEAVTADWPEPLRRRAFTILLEGMNAQPKRALRRPTREPRDGAKKTVTRKKTAARQRKAKQTK
jgi:AcrR family transcriptional regulator